MYFTSKSCSSRWSAVITPHRPLSRLKVSNVSPRKRNTYVNEKQQVAFSFFDARESRQTKFENGRNNETRNQKHIYIYERSEKLGKSRWKLGFRFKNACIGEDTDVIDPLCQRERALGMELETRRGWSSPFFKKGTKQRDRIHGSFDLVENLSLPPLISNSFQWISVWYIHVRLGVYSRS